MKTTYELDAAAIGISDSYTELRDLLIDIAGSRDLLRFAGRKQIIREQIKWLLGSHNHLTDSLKTANSEVEAELENWKDDDLEYNSRSSYFHGYFAQYFSTLELVNKVAELAEGALTKTESQEFEDSVSEILEAVLDLEAIPKIPSQRFWSPRWIRC